MSNLSVRRVEITDVKGIAHAELDLAGRSLTLLRGRNGVGKSSILDAISALFAGGSDSSLIRKGAKQAKIKLELSDGRYIEKIQTPKGARLVAMDENGEPIPSPQKYIESLNTSFSFDPLAFLRAPKKDRAAFAAKHANLTFPASELRALKFGQLDAGGPVRDLVGPDATLSLDDFEKLRERVYSLRRARNTEAGELDKTISNLRKSLPMEGEPEAGGGQNMDELQAKLEAFTAALQADLAQVAQQVDEARQQARAEYDNEAAQLRKVFDDGMRAAADKQGDALIAIAAAEVEAVTEIRTGSDAERSQLQKGLAEAQAGLKRAGEVEALAKHLEEQRERLAQKATEADLLDQALKALDQLKKQKLDSLPIPGLEIRDNEVYKNGIPFDQLNHAARYTLAIEIGSLGMGDLPLVVSDEAEALDEKEFAAFCAAVKESGMQFLIARVDSGELRSEPQQALKL
jgi:hypothetical protein